MRLKDRKCEVNRSPPQLTILSELTVQEGGMADLSDTVLQLTDLDAPSKYLLVELYSTSSLGWYILLQIYISTLL